MINWQSVIFNSFWIVGLATLLAALSYNIWQAEQDGLQLRRQLNGLSFQRALWLSIMLITIGLAGTSQATWETILWSVLSLIAFASLLISYRK